MSIALTEHRVYGGHSLYNLEVVVVVDVDAVVGLRDTFTAWIIRA
jgi:hypothetical protein